MQQSSAVRGAVVVATIGAPTVSPLLLRDKVVVSVNVAEQVLPLLSQVSPVYIMSIMLWQAAVRAGSDL